MESSYLKKAQLVGIFWNFFIHTKKQQSVSLNYVKILAEKMSGNNQISFKYKSSIILITKKIGQFKSSFPYDLWYVNITWYLVGPALLLLVCL